MAELKIERNHPGKTARYWRRDGIVVVQLGRELSELEQRRVIRDAEREHGIHHRRRRILPIPLIPPRLRDAARDHPTTTAAVTGIVATGVAAGAILSATMPSDEPRPRRRKPPAVAGPSPTHGPPTIPQPRRPTLPPSPPPGRGDGGTPRPDRTAAPAAARPTPDRPTSRPPAAPSGPPSGTAPPTAPPAEPPTRPPTRCLVHLDALGLVDVRLLCAH